MTFEWIKNGDTYSHDSKYGNAIVFELSLNKWRWEANSANYMQSFDMDCWWGNSTSLKEAQYDAEKELLRWPI